MVAMLVGKGAAWAEVREPPVNKAGKMIESIVFEIRMMYSTSIVRTCSKGWSVILTDRAPVRLDLDQCRRRIGARASTRLRTSFLVTGLTTTLITMVGAFAAQAVPLTPFRYETQAQRHCPADTVVWLDFRKRTYYSKGQKRYALGLDGSFVCRSEARASGYRRSVFGVR